MVLPKEGTTDMVNIGWAVYMNFLAKPIQTTAQCSGTEWCMGCIGSQ